MGIHCRALVAKEVWLQKGHAFTVTALLHFLARSEGEAPVARAQGDLWPTARESLSATICQGLNTHVSELGSRSSPVEPPDEMQPGCQFDRGPWVASSQRRQ